MLLIIVGAAIIGVALWYYLVKPMSHWSDMGVTQTKPWILLGDSWMALFRTVNVYEFVERLYRLYPNERYIGCYNFRSPVLLLRDPELLKQLGVKDFDSFTDHAPVLDPEADPFWSRNLFALTGERWREMRNVMSPTFTTSKIKSLFGLIVEASESFVNYFQANDDEVIAMDMKDTFTRFTNDVIATTAFGVKVDSLQDRENKFYQMGKRITDFSGVIKSLKFLLSQVFPTLFKYLGVTFFDSVAAKFFSEVINDTVKAREEKKIVRPDMINLLLEARKSEGEISGQGQNKERTKRTVEISNNEITSQAIIFFFAGFDTVSTVLSFGSYELAINKEVQDKLREEIVETAKKGKITYDALQEMRYMDMVISEIVRKWPPFPFLDRLCTKNYTLEPANKDKKAVTIQEGHEVWFPIFALHKDPKYHPNPEKFDPERFSEENKNNIVPYTYLPFGLGPRLCIGNRFALIEIKALLFHLLQQFEIVPTEKTAIPLVLKKDFELSVVGGIQLGLKRIKA